MAGVGKQVLRTQSGLGHRWGRAAGLRRPFPFVLPGALRAIEPLSAPPSDGDRLLVSPAAAEQPGWPMDVPESRAGGPAAKSRWLAPLFAPWEDEGGAVGEWVPGCASGT